MPDEHDPDGVIDLSEARSDGEVLRIEAASPFERLSEKQRMRLIVRVLCELVAYDEIIDPVDESLSA